MGQNVTGSGASCGHVMGKQSLEPAIEELWNAWEIHCLILISLFLQVFLFVFGGLRRRTSWWFLRTVLWLAYVSADSVAVFVLGHLAVHASQPRHQLMSFWAPFILVHLGGQDTISAFAKQDNELWLRHLLNLVTQVAVAAYVVVKASWPDHRLWKAMVLMFLCGCFKYAERTIILYSANPDQLRKWSQDVQSRKLMGRRHVRGMFLESEGTEQEAIKAVKSTVKGLSKGSSTPANVLFWEAVTLGPDIILLDAPHNHQVHITSVAADNLPAIVKMFLSMSEDRHKAYEYVGAVLEHCYRRLYTKDPIRENLLNIFPVTLFPLVSTIVALVLFIAAEKGDQLHASRVDVRVSYLLLIVGIVLDVSSAAIFIISHLRFCLPSRILYLLNYIQCSRFWKQWSQQLQQYNMIRRACMHPIKKLLGYDVTPTPLTEDDTSIKLFILDTLLNYVDNKQWNIASTRGQVALHNWMNNRDPHHSVDSTRVTLRALQETVIGNVDFPTGMLIWHIATDICYHLGGTNSDNQLKKKMQISREISNYILYLIFKCGVMATTNSQIVHDNVYKEIGKILGPSERLHLSEKDIVMELFEAKKNKNDPHDNEESEGRINSWDAREIEIEELANNDNTADNHMKKILQNSKTLKSPVLPRACVVAQELIRIKDEADRWDLIALVWAEMVYYTAPRCGGSFHYDYLSKGGEFITHVLLLMYYLGPFMPPPDA